MSVVVLRLLGVGLLGPGLPSWAQARPVLAGEAPFDETTMLDDHDGDGFDDAQQPGGLEAQSPASPKA